MTAIAVTIAGSDSSGGAGIQADLKTFSALGVYGASVITALTAQNTQGVRAIHDVPADFITAQIDAVFSDLEVNAVKIGMLSQTATIAAVAKGLDRHRAKNIVLDPVMIATSGDRLLAADAVAALRASLIPRALVVTPNLPEAAALLEHAPAHSEAEMESQARALLDLGVQSVLIKGGHGEGPESVDLLVDATSVTVCRNAHCYQEHARQRLYIVFGGRSRARQSLDLKSAARTPKPMSPQPSHPLKCAGSATATGHCTIFTNYGESHDHPTEFHYRNGHRCRPRCCACDCAGANAEMAHGYLVAKALAGTWHVRRTYC